MNRWHGKCSNSGWLMEQWGQNGGRRSDIMGMKGEYLEKGEDDQLVFLKGGERFFWPKKIKDVFSMEDPACTKVETRSGTAQSGTWQNARLHLLCFCNSAALCYMVSLYLRPPLPVAKPSSPHASPVPFS